MLENRVALVTGAARGLGRAYALALAEIGADVVVADVDLHSYREFDIDESAMTADTTVEEIEDRGGRACGIEVDLSEHGQAELAVSTALESFGHLDIVVCNAGGGLGSSAGGHASTMDWEQFDQVIKRNLYATVFTCMAAAPTLKAQHSGKIVTVTSTAGLKAVSGGAFAHYGTAKAAIVMYTRYLASEMGPFGVTVNCVAPGVVPTGRIATKRRNEGRTFDDVVKGIPLGRIASTNDVSSVVQFLAGPGSDYMTGVVVPVDGGALL